MRWSVEWGTSSSIDVASLRELDALLDHLNRQAVFQPFMVVISSPRDRSLAIGLGQAQSVLNYQASADPPYYASLGDAAADGELIFDFGGESTEYGMRHAVPLDLAREAVRCFCKNDDRPDNLKWEAV
jgi:hypothetical protein